jgi:hypothetical protein
VNIDGTTGFLTYACFEKDFYGDCGATGGLAPAGVAVFTTVPPAGTYEYQITITSRTVIPAGQPGIALAEGRAGLTTGSSPWYTINAGTNFGARTYTYKNPSFGFGSQGELGFTITIREIANPTNSQTYTISLQSVVE